METNVVYYGKLPDWKVRELYNSLKQSDAKLQKDYTELYEDYSSLLKDYNLLEKQYEQLVPPEAIVVNKVGLGDIVGEAPTIWEDLTDIWMRDFEGEETNIREATLVCNISSTSLFEGIRLKIGAKYKWYFDLSSLGSAQSLAISSSNCKIITDKGMYVWSSSIQTPAGTTVSGFVKTT